MKSKPDKVVIDPLAAAGIGGHHDSVDRLPGEIGLPGDLAEDDYVLFQGLGACSTATNTRFNGFGELAIETVLSQAR